MVPAEKEAWMERMVAQRPAPRMKQPTMIIAMALAKRSCEWVKTKGRRRSKRSAQSHARGKVEKATDATRRREREGESWGDEEGLTLLLREGTLGCILLS